MRRSFFRSTPITRRLGSGNVLRNSARSRTASSESDCRSWSRGRTPSAAGSAVPAPTETLPRNRRQGDAHRSGSAMEDAAAPLSKRWAIRDGHIGGRRWQCREQKLRLQAGPRPNSISTPCAGRLSIMSRAWAARIQSVSRRIILRQLRDPLEKRAAPGVIKKPARRRPLPCESPVTTAAAKGPRLRATRVGSRPAPRFHASFDLRGEARACKLPALVG